MKVSRCVILSVLILAAAPLWTIAASAADAPKVFRAGAAAVDITPTKFPVIINGNFTEGKALRAYDPLHARALVLDDGATRLAIVVVDLCGVEARFLDEAKQLAHEATGIPTDHITISATHTHSAPSAWGVLGSRVDSEYVAYLIPQVARAISLAAKNLEPARIGWTVTSAEGLTHNRRWIARSDAIVTDPFGNKTARAMMHPGYENQKFIGPSGPVDTDLSLLAVQSTAGRPIAVLANFSQHYFGSRAVSADYYGRFCERLAELIGGGKVDPRFVGIMSQGTSGDLMWMDYGAPRSPITIDQYSDQVARVAYAAWQKIKYHDWVPLKMTERKLKFRRRVPDAARLAWAKPLLEKMQARLPQTVPEVYAQETRFLAAEPEVELKLQAIGIGDLGIAAIPNEVFALTGLKLKRQSPFKQQINICQANGAFGYIPPPEQHRLGGYTTWPARSAGLEERAEPKIVKAMLSMLEELSGKPRRNFIEPIGDYASAVLASKPAAYWRLRDMDATRAVDASGYGRDAMYEPGVALFLDGPPGPGLSGGWRGSRAAQFAGGRVRADLKELKVPYSVEFWFWNGLPTDAREVTGYLFSRGIDGQQAGYHLGFSGFTDFAGKESYDKAVAAQGGLFFNVTSQFRTWESFAGRTRIPAKSWNHVALAFDGEDARVYLNGNPEPEILAPKRVEYVSSAMPSAWSQKSRLFFGGRSDNFANFEGKLAEVAVYDRVLKPEEIAAHFRAAMDPAAVESIPSEREVPWKPLFNGKNLDGFYVLIAGQKRNVDPQKFFQVDGGAIHVFKDTPPGTKTPIGVVVTDKQYSHYHLRFQYKWGQKKFPPREKTVRDAGLMYHMVGPDKVWPMSIECQVQEKDVGDIFTVFTRVDTTVDPKDKTKFLAATRGGVPITRGNPHGVERVIKDGTYEVDGWNTVEVIVLGDRATHIVNGHVNNCLWNAKQPGPKEGPPWVPLAKGHIAFQAEFAEVYYRNIEIREFPDKDENGKQQNPLPPREDRVRGEPLQNVPHPNPLPKGEGEAGNSPYPDGSWPKSPAESLAAWRVHPGYRVELVAAEPLVRDPVAIDWGPDGKLWVVEMADYPLGIDGHGKPGGRVRYLEDTKGTGHYDKSTLFLDGVNFPTGIMAWHNGVIVTAAPEIFYAEDTTGAGRANVRRPLFTGFLEGNQQLRVNGLRWGLDNWVYCASGSHYSGYGAASQIRSVLTGARFPVGSRDFRIRPDEGLLDPQSGPAQFGRDRDDWGNWFGVQNSYPIWHYILEDQYMRRNPFAAPPDPRRQLSDTANAKVYPVSKIQKRYHNFQESGHFTSACSAMVYRDDLLFPAGGLEHSFTCEPVHNLVHHRLLRDDGVSFTARRADDEQDREFLASADPWCRPVMVRTGPDGALWVVDMYRYVIEHPEWLPPEGKKELGPFLRSGEDKGRIYRIVPVDRPARPIPRLDKLDTAGLFAALSSPNGWQRDTAQRLLVWRADKSAVAPLEKLAAESPLPQSRLQALCTLDGLGALRPEVIERALSDSHPAVRRHAVRLAETRAAAAPRLIAAAAALATDPDAKVRLQLACTLGEWDAPLAAHALGSLARTDGGDPYLAAAVMSSVNKKNIATVIDCVLAAGHPREATVAQLFGLAGDFGQDRLLGDLLLNASQTRDGRIEAWQFAALSGALDVIERRHLSLVDQLDAANRKQLNTAVARARADVVDTGSPDALRIAAVRLLLREPDRRQDDLKTAAGLLMPRSSAALQAAVIEHLARQPDRPIGQILLRGWGGYTPARRSQVLFAIASRESWIGALLESIDRGAVRVGEINTPMRQRLLSRSDPRLAREIARRLGSPVGDRQQVLDRFQPAAKMAGDFAKGAILFKNRCATCHRVGGAGQEVGPNLSAVTNKTPGGLLESILDPSRVVEAKYVNYVATTVDGRSFTGILEVETGSSVTLLSAEGKRQVILRSEIEEFKSTGKSLMPDGLEQGLATQDLADLLAFLMAPSP